MSESRVEGSGDKNAAIIKAFHVAHENGIAGYAIETKYDGWIVSDRSLLVAALKDLLDAARYVPVADNAGQAAVLLSQSIKAGTKLLTDLGA